MDKLLFDLKSTQPRNGSKRHGGGKYGEIVLRRIVERGLPVECFYDSSVWLNPDMQEYLLKHNVQLYDVNKKDILTFINEFKASLVFVPCVFNGALWSQAKCNVIGVIHGLRNLEMPIDNFEFLYKQSIKTYFKSLVKRISKRYTKYRQRKWIRPSLIANNIKIVTVSNHSKYSFKSFFPELRPDISVFYSPSTSTIETKSGKYKERFFLLVSANRPAKNNLRAIIALDQLFSHGYADDMKVKITGVKDSSAFRYKIKSKKHFEFLGFVDEEELDQLYHDAYCFIYPTLNEGFGYPPLEAMHYGVPVLSSPLSSIPEVCGDNVMYFNPFSIEEIMNRILQILDEETHEKYSRLSHQRYDLITKKQNEDLDRLIDYIYGLSETSI